MFCRQDLEQITWWAGREGSDGGHALAAGRVLCCTSFIHDLVLVGFMTITHVSGELAVAQRR